MTPPAIVSLPHSPAALDSSIVGESSYVNKRTGRPHSSHPDTAQAWCSRPRCKACCAACVPGFTRVAAHMHPSIPGSQSPELPTMYQAGDCDICVPLECGRIVKFCQVSMHLANPLFFRRDVCLCVMCVSCPHLSPRAFIWRDKCNAEDFPAGILALPPPGTAAPPPPSRAAATYVRCVQ